MHQVISFLTRQHRPIMSCLLIVAPLFSAVAMGADDATLRSVSDAAQRRMDENRSLTISWSTSTKDESGNDARWQYRVFFGSEGFRYEWDTNDKMGQKRVLVFLANQSVAKTLVTTLRRENEFPQGEISLQRQQSKWEMVPLIWYARWPDKRFFDDSNGLTCDLESLKTNNQQGFVGEHPCIVLSAPLFIAQIGSS